MQYLVLLDPCDVFNRIINDQEIKYYQARVLYPYQPKKFPKNIGGKKVTKYQSTEELIQL